MTICRYYAQGTCRFGDRCRFEHIDSSYDTYNNYNQRNVRNDQERYGRENTGYGNYRNDNQYGNQRYEPKNYYGGSQRGYSPDRYSDNYRQEPSRYQSAYGNQYQDYQGRSRQGYEHQPRYDEQNYGRNQQHASSNYRNDNVYGQNPYRWLSDDYKKNQEYGKNEYESDSYHTSTPKSKVPFSFKVPESEIKKSSSSMFQVDEQDSVRAESVKEDAKAWELGGQWPFSCYFPNPSKHAFPGFYDVSPEELRDIAYKTKQNNSYESYIQAVQTALTQVTEQRAQLQIPTPQLLNVLRQIWDGEDLYSSSKKIDPTFIQYDKTAIENMGNKRAFESMETPVDPNHVSSAASFSFKIPTEIDSSAKTSVPAFSFKLPAGTEIKPVIPVSDGDQDIYTPLEKLTEEEKQQFSASTFVLGKIPTKPPPQMLCS